MSLAFRHKISQKTYIIAAEGASAILILAKVPKNNCLTD